MKVYTVTFFNAHNFGAVLQCFALQQALLSFDVQTQVVDFRQNQERILRKIEFNKFGISSVLWDVSHVIRYFKFRNSFNRFHTFSSKYIISTDTIKNYGELKDKVGDGDIYIVGSDQVWNPMFNTPPSFDNFFLLKWVPESKKKYSYAASTGIPPEIFRQTLWDDFFNKIVDFKTVSIRERSMYNFFNKKLFGKIRIDVDPVFLIDRKQWFSLIKSVKSKGFKYVLVFELATPNYLHELIDEIKHQWSLPVILLTTNFYSKIDNADQYIYDAGPLEFLRLLWDAECIFSTSFHATAFSIIFNKDFYACLSEHVPELITNLLEWTGLKSRILRNSNFDICSVDYSNINYILEKQRKESMLYIRSILNDIQVTI